MKIAFYANEIARQGESGVKTYSLEIIKHLLEIDGKNEYALYAAKDIGLEGASQKAHMIIAEPKKRFWAFSVFGRRMPVDKPDIIFMPLQTFPFLKIPKDKPKIVITVHDVAFLLFPGYFKFWRRQILKFHTKRAVNLADKIIVPSLATKNDIIHFYNVPPEKIKVVYHGSSRKLLDMGKKSDARVMGLSEGCPYILFVGSLQPRKNIVRLIHAFETLKKTGKYKHKLIICGGKGWLYWKIYYEIQHSPFHEDIIVVGHAGNDLVASLYANAAVFVMPSLYEGFGLPILEAMSFGLPVVCADNSSLSEIAGDAALLADGYSAQDFYLKIERALTDDKLRLDLTAKGLKRAQEFSWDKSARETLGVLEEAYK